MWFAHSNGFSRGLRIGAFIAFALAASRVEAQTHGGPTPDVPQLGVERARGAAVRAMIRAELWLQRGTVHRPQALHALRIARQTLDEAEAIHERSPASARMLTRLQNRILETRTAQAPQSDHGIQPETGLELLAAEDDFSARLSTRRYPDIEVPIRRMIEAMNRDPDHEDFHRGVAERVSQEFLTVAQHLAASAELHRNPAVAVHFNAIARLNAAAHAPAVDSEFQGYLDDSRVAGTQQWIARVQESIAIRRFEQARNELDLAQRTFRTINFATASRRHWVGDIGHTLRRLREQLGMR